MSLFFLNEGAMMVASIDEEPSFAWDIPRVLFEGDYVMVGNFGRPYDVAADGQRFLMMKRIDSSSSRDIHVVLNWHEEPKERVPVP